MTNWSLLIGFGIIDGAIFAVASVGFTMQFGITRVVNFAYGNFLTFGAYMALVADEFLHLNFWGALAVAAVSAALASLLVGHLIFTPFARAAPATPLHPRSGVRNVVDPGERILLIWGAQYRQLSYSSSGQSAHSFGPFVVTSSQLLYLIIAVVALLAIDTLLKYTKLGKMMRAMSDDFTLATVCGLRTARITDAAWLITGGLAGVAGVIEAMQVRSFDPTLGSTFVYLIIAAAVFGGIGRPYGAMVGAMVIGLATQLGVPLIGSAISPVVVFAALVVLMVVRPAGLFGPSGRAAFANE